MLDCIYYVTVKELSRSQSNLMLTKDRYENQEAQDNHRNTEYFAAVTKKAGEEKLLAAPLDVRVIKAVGGFSLRG